MTHHRFHGSMMRWLLMLAVLATVASQQSVWAAKNVILMIADGSGHNTWLATSMYQGRVGQQAYDQSGWKRFACSTYPLNTSRKPTGTLQQDESLVYDPAKAWDAERTKWGFGDFAAYIWLTSTFTDSAAAATALATGQKSYNNAINWTNDDRPMRGQTIAEIAKAQGKSAGAITTVQWSDATPAGLGGAHNINRSHHAEIANEMLGSDCLSVIMGGGNPDYDNDGQPLPAGAARNYEWVGGPDTWQSLKSGQSPWKLIEKKADFEALATSPTPAKLLGVPQVGKTLQEKRRHGNSSESAAIPAGQPFADELTGNVPSLAVMTKAAIHCLENNPKGFYLMIEGGAVDWADHANEPDRMIEEQIDYVKAVEAVVAWVESHGGWNDTLLILTADHETGLIWGPDSAKVAFQPIVDHGKGQLPGFKYNSHGHSNSLIPLYARGPGSQRFDALVKGTDLKAGEVWQFSGRFVDNTDVFRVMQAEVSGAAETAVKDR